MIKANPCVCYSGHLTQPKAVQNLSVQAERTGDTLGRQKKNSSGSFVMKRDSEEGKSYTSSTVPGLKVYSGTIDDRTGAKKLRSHIEMMYKKDPEFRHNIDKVIDKHASISFTVGSYSENGVGSRGWSNVNGNEILIDKKYVNTTYTVAHEVAHSVGYRHGRDMEAVAYASTDDILGARKAQSNYESKVPLYEGRDYFKNNPKHIDPNYAMAGLKF